MNQNYNAVHTILTSEEDEDIDINRGHYQEYQGEEKYFNIDQASDKNDDDDDDEAGVSNNKHNRQHKNKNGMYAITSLFFLDMVS